MMRPLYLAALAAVVLGAAAAAHEVKAGPLVLGDLSLRASLGAVPTSAAYLTITNTGDKPDRLLSVDCRCARMAMMHKTEIRSGIASMDMVDSVVIPAHGKVTFSPDGLHIMLMGVTTPLKAGALQPMTLRFQRAGVVAAGFHVRDVITGH